MAIARGAGTEIIRSASFEYVDSETTQYPLIIGVQHHIYTVLSIICCAKTSNTGMEVFLTGFDAIDGASGANINIFKTDAVENKQTYVWNDKFSFNGYEPTGVTADLSTVAEQDAIADQGGSTAQKLMMGKDVNGDQWEVHITYIDQNNA